jgi:hypothetical protein
MVASVACCVGGILAFANAGFFALGWGLLIGSSMDFIIKRGRRIYSLILILLSVMIIMYSVRGRAVTMIYYPEIKILSAITGVRDIKTPIKLEGGQLVFRDPTVGRIEDAVRTVRFVATEEPLWGIGIRVPGKDAI